MCHSSAVGGECSENPHLNQASRLFFENHPVSSTKSRRRFICLFAPKISLKAKKRKNVILTKVEISPKFIGIFPYSPFALNSSWRRGGSYINQIKNAERAKCSGCLDAGLGREGRKERVHLRNGFPWSGRRPKVFVKIGADLASAIDLSPIRPQRNSLRHR